MPRVKAGVVRNWGGALRAAAPHGLALAFPFVLAYLVYRYRVNVPYLDQWSMVPLLEKAGQGTLAFRDLFAQHIEHRPFVSRIIMLVLARWTGWNTTYELALNFAVAAATFFVLDRTIRGAWRETGLKGGDRWIAVLVSLFVFSLAQWENWLWGWQIQIFLNVFAVTAGVYLLARPSVSWKTILPAAVCGFIATFSFGNGLVFWFTGFFVLLFSPAETRQVKTGRLAVWSVVSAVAFGLYFYRWGVAPHHPLRHALANFRDGPLAFTAGYVQYVFAFLGSPITSRYQIAAGVAGSVTLLAASVHLLRARIATLRAMSPLIALSLYSIGSALLIGVGRLAIGVEQATRSRYITISSLFWIAIVVLLGWIVEAIHGQRGLSLGRKLRVDAITLNLRATRENEVLAISRELRLDWVRQLVPMLTACLIIVSTLAHSLGSVRDFRRQFEGLSAAQYELWLLEDERVLQFLYPVMDDLEAYTIVLAQHRLSVFSGPFPPGFTDFSVDAVRNPDAGVVTPDTIVLDKAYPVYAQAPGTGAAWDIRLPAAQLLAPGRILLQTGIVLEQLPAPGETFSYGIEVSREGAVVELFEVDVQQDEPGQGFWGFGASVRELCPPVSPGVGDGPRQAQGFYDGPFPVSFRGETGICAVVAPYDGLMAFPEEGILRITMDLSAQAGGRVRVRLLAGEGGGVLWLAPDIQVPQVVR